MSTQWVFDFTVSETEVIIVIIQWPGLGPKRNYYPTNVNPKNLFTQPCTVEIYNLLNLRKNIVEP